MEQIATDIVNDVDIRVKGILAEDLPFDTNETRWDRRWYDKYGILTKNLLIRDRNGQKHDDRRFKGVFINDKYTNLVSRYRILYPNEEVENHLIGFAEKLNLEIKNRYSSHYGDAQYWELLSDEFDQNIEYQGKNDVIKIGLIVRNSLSTNVALGADAYTWRVFCENGAVARGRDFGFALKHVGRDPEKLIRSFLDGLNKILVDSTELIEYYRKAAALRMNKKIAQEMKKRHIPVRAFPECMAYDYKNKSVVLTREDDLWKAFNDVTERVWHPERFSNKPRETGFANRAEIEITMHSILKNAVEGKYA